MKKQLILSLLFAVPLLCTAQSQLARMYDYDAAGNRTVCAVINLTPPLAPPNLPPTDSTENHPPATENLETPIPFPFPDTATTKDSAGEYFVERMGNTEIKIYPNPTSEKITLEFSGAIRVENLRPVQLYSLSGQLLQELPVHSAATEISLAGYAKGVYILKVNADGRTENWKVIKQ